MSEFMSTAEAILDQLRIVEAEREMRGRSQLLGDQVILIKHYQQLRFRHTYADLLQSERYGPASRFFLEELYGPEDFTQRDAQFARVVPALVRLFPSEIVATVATLARLHALSEQLDSKMGRNLVGVVVDSHSYVRAWQLTGCSEERERQIELTVEVAGSLDRLTGKPLLRNSLRLMRTPARAAGLGDLQRFLEAGFDTFRSMQGARQFIELVWERERTLALALFSADADSELGTGAFPFLPPDNEAVS